MLEVKLGWQQVVRKLFNVCLSLHDYNRLANAKSQIGLATGKLVGNLVKVLQTRQTAETSSVHVARCEQLSNSL